MNPIILLWDHGLMGNYDGIIHQWVLYMIWLVVEPPRQEKHACQPTICKYRGKLKMPIKPPTRKYWKDQQNTKSYNISIISIPLKYCKWFYIKRAYHRIEILFAATDHGQPTIHQDINKHQPMLANINHYQPILSLIGNHEAWNQVILNHPWNNH